MKRLFIINTTMADNRLVRASTVEEVSDRDARLLIALGDAIDCDEVPAERAALPCHVVSHKDGTHTVSTEPPKTPARRKR